MINLSASKWANNDNQTYTFPESSTHLTAGFLLGIEFRRSITEKLTFFHGPNASYSYAVNIRTFDNPAIPVRERKSVFQTHTVEVPYTFGFLYSINSHFLLAVEINPELNFSYKIENQALNLDSTTFLTGFSLSNKSGFLSIVYRI